MDTKQRIATHVKTKFGDTPTVDDTFETAESSIEEVKRLIGWLEYVSEHEYTDTERKRLIAVSRRFAEAAQPIASKYID